MPIFDGPTPTARLYRHVRRARARGRVGVFSSTGSPQRTGGDPFSFHAHLAVGTLESFSRRLGEPSPRDVRALTRDARTGGDLLTEVALLHGLKQTDFDTVRAPWADGFHQLTAGRDPDTAVLIALFAGHRSMGNPAECRGVALHDTLAPDQPLMVAGVAHGLKMPLFARAGSEVAPPPQVRLRFHPAVAHPIDGVATGELVLASRVWSRGVSLDGRRVFPPASKRSVGFASPDDRPAMAGNTYHTYRRFQDAGEAKAFGEVAQITVLVLRPHAAAYGDVPANADVDHWNVAVSRRSGRLIDSTLHAADYNSLTLYFHQLAALLPDHLRPRLAGRG